MITLMNANARYDFDGDARLLSVKNGDGFIPFQGVAFDFGADGRNITGLLAFNSLLDNRTWELPEIKPDKAFVPPKPHVTQVSGNKLLVSYETSGISTQFSYCLRDDGVLALEASLTNHTKQTVWLNTFTFAPVLDDAARFYFPANVPHGLYDSGKLEEKKPVCAGLVSFATSVVSGVENAENGFNLLFIDDIEKWSTGVWREGGSTYFASSASLEAELCPDESLQVGTFYIQPCGQTDKPHRYIRDFVTALGYHAVTGGRRDGIMYSCHPYGTMDAGFATLKEDLFRYAERLPALKAMGIDHVWLLPVFDHNEDGVYHSNDQRVIDTRYGGEEGCRYFCEQARNLGMTVLFDYVPHGPAPEHALAKNNPDWCAKKQDGSLQIEWKCVSMDYNHPGYQDYTTALVSDHVRRFGIEGARIDCAMGGLSNWRPYPGHRPSGDSVQSGVNISAAIRRGFVGQGVKPLNMPENFHPIPPYYNCTDVFYGFSLYRVFCELEPLFTSDPVRYAAQLTRWLSAEKETLPEHLCKLRFLGNHDTVSWVWQAKRAVDIYGTEGAKALWAFITLIDGIPMIYQGDEDDSLFGRTGAAPLRDYFTELFKKRRETFGSSDAIRYMETGTALCAFTRGEYEEWLCLVNLGPETEIFDMPLYGGPVRVLPYSYAVLPDVTGMKP